MTLILLVNSLLSNWSTFFVHNILICSQQGYQVVWLITISQAYRCMVIGYALWLVVTSRVDYCHGDYGSQISLHCYKQKYLRARSVRTFSSRNSSWWRSSYTNYTAIPGWIGSRAWIPGNGTEPNKDLWLFSETRLISWLMNLSRTQRN